MSQGHVLPSFLPAPPRPHMPRPALEGAVAWGGRCHTRGSRLGHGAYPRHRVKPSPSATQREASRQQPPSTQPPRREAGEKPGRERWNQAPPKPPPPLGCSCPTVDMRNTIFFYFFLNFTQMGH